jgi:hypothetical protein
MAHKMGSASKSSSPSSSVKAEVPLVKVSAPALGRPEAFGVEAG